MTREETPIEDVTKVVIVNQNGRRLSFFEDEIIEATEVHAGHEAPRGVDGSRWVEVTVDVAESFDIGRLFSPTRVVLYGDCWVSGMEFVGAKLESETELRVIAA